MLDKNISTDLLYLACLPAWISKTTETNLDYITPDLKTLIAECLFDTEYEKEHLRSIAITCKEAIISP